MAGADGAAVDEAKASVGSRPWMRLRGLSGARDEFHLAAIVQNLKALANHVWRPPPNTMVGCAA